MMTLKEISKIISIPFVGDGEIFISGPAEPKAAKKTNLALAMDKRFLEDLKNSEADAALIKEGIDWKEFGLRGALVLGNSKYALSKITNLFKEPLDVWEGVHPTALVADSAVIGANTSIGPFCVISDRVKIAENSIILSHVCIGSDTEIGRKALIYQGVKLGSKVKIGDHFIAHQNVVIGCDGFSFVSPRLTSVDSLTSSDDDKKDKYESSVHLRVASLGSVHIGDNVEVGAGSAIDKGTIASTRIGHGTKLDNMVHIAHNVVIGRDCLLCGQVGIAGSAKIGDQVILGGQVGVADHVSIADKCIVAGKSGVSSNVPKGQFMMGNPAMKIETNIEAYKSLRRLPRILKQLQKIRKTFDNT